MNQPSGKFSMMPQTAHKQAIKVENATANHPATWRFDNRIVHT